MSSERVEGDVQFLLSYFLAVVGNNKDAVCMLVRVKNLSRALVSGPSRSAVGMPLAPRGHAFFYLQAVFKMLASFPERRT